MPPCRIITIDIAALKRTQLHRKLNHSHIRGDGASLPFEDQTFSLGVSNMALDFMPQEARVELHRVLKPGAPVYLNFHHPTLIEDGLRSLTAKAQKKKLTKREQQVFNFWQYLKDNQIFFKDKKQIQQAFHENFVIERVEEEADEWDKWWAVDMIRR